EDPEVAKFREQDLKFLLEMEFLFKGTIAIGFAAYAPSEYSRQNEGFNTRTKETNDNIDDNTEMEVNEPEINTTTQTTSSTKESGQRKKGMSSSLSTNDSSSGDDDHITKNKVLMFVVANVTNYFMNYVVKNPCRDSSMTDHHWVFEILNGHPIRCYQRFIMKKLVFLELCDILETKYNLKKTQNVSIYDVLEAVCMFAKDIIKPIDPSFRDTPDEILKNAKYRPYFRDCIGAIDGTHIRVCVLSHLQGVYIGRKGYIITNVMVVCDFSMCFTFVWIVMEALRKPALHFPHPPQGKYYLVDSGYLTFMNFLGPHKKTRNDKSDEEFDSLDEDNKYIDIDEDESEVGPSTTTSEEWDARNTLQMERFREFLKNTFST
ncbi:hypothetical protein D0Y65_033887, partial [Glycine soja]